MTRLKTCQYAFPVLASLTNNTLTNLTQITVYLPEATKTIKKAWVEISMDDIVTATGGTITTKTINLRLGAASYTSTTNANTLTNSGENICFFIEREFTSHFTTNWTGTSMTCDVQLQINQSTGTTLGMVNVCCILYVTYEYDDTATTQLKTVWIPLNAPVTTLPTTKTSHDTIPALDTYLPEASKTYRSIFIVTQSNTTQANTTDNTVTYELSSLGTHTTGNYEAALSSDRWCRYVWEITSYITTNTTHTFNVHSSLTARHHCLQAWLVVTYEYNESTTTSVLNSLMLPMNINSPLGTSATVFQRSFVNFYIQESNISLQRLAFFAFWQNTGNEVSLNARMGSGSFIAYTHTGSALVCGNKSLMIRNDSPTGITIARGINTMFVDMYNTSTATRGGNAGGFWIINYTSDKYTGGSGAHNHTVIWPLHLEGTAATSVEVVTASGNISIPEDNYYISHVGMAYQSMSQTSPSHGVGIKVENQSGAGGLFFDRIYSDVGHSDLECGLVSIYCQCNANFNRWANDPDPKRLQIESPRRYICSHGGGAPVLHNSLSIIPTYHSILYSVSGNITNSNSGLVNINLYKYNQTERLLTTSRSGNGPYTFTWYDNTEPVYTTAYESNVYKGMSGTGIAS